MPDGVETEKAALDGEAAVGGEPEEEEAELAGAQIE